LCGFQRYAATKVGLTNTAKFSFHISCSSAQLKIGNLPCKPVARRFGFEGKIRYQRDKYFCFYYICKTTISGYNIIWGHKNILEVLPPNVPVAGLVARVMNKTGYTKYSTGS